MLQGASTADQLQNQHNQRNDEQDVNVGSQNVESDESKEPERSAE